MPLELLEIIASVNSAAARPRPVDPAVLLTLLKIRRLVEEATNLAVRAASTIASPTLTSTSGSLPGYSALYTLHTAAGPGIPAYRARLSKERKFRMREHACQKLGKSYRLDELACGFAVAQPTQGSSPLAEIAELVLGHNPKDLHARYVHIFHQKGPPSQMGDLARVQAVSEIMLEQPAEPELLRSRGMLKAVRKDLGGAVQDYTLAMFMLRPCKTPHRDDPGLQVASPSANAPSVAPAGKGEPSSLEGQLLFHRASAYLSMACKHVAQSISDTPSREDASSGAPGVKGLSLDGEAHKGHQKNGPHGLVKVYARRALRDYMSFISELDYSPNLPLKAIRGFNERIDHAIQATRSPRSNETSSQGEHHKVYSVADLFATVPAFQLPSCPAKEPERGGGLDSYESVTFHPLLADTLHSMLLCHCLVQTPRREIARHAHVVARIVRVLDGYPIFQSSWSPARADWVDVLRQTGQWLPLNASWATLCAPAPLPQLHSPKPGLGKQSFLSPIRSPHPKEPNPSPGGIARDDPEVPPIQRWSVDSCADRFLVTDRAAAVAKWIQQVPQVTCSTRRKQRQKKQGTTASTVDDTQPMPNWKDGAVESNPDVRNDHHVSRGCGTLGNNQTAHASNPS